MKRILLSLLLIVMGFPGLQFLQATQEVGHQGNPVPITLMGPTSWPQRTPFVPNSAVRDQFRLVVRDRETWIEVWKRIYRVDSSHGQYPKLPEIDFSREMVVVAAMGEQPTTGYSVIIDAAYERAVRIEVVVKSVVNVKCGVLTMMTSPVDIVRLPKMDHSVVFREIHEVPDCKLP